jgi:DNA mismatch repair protein MutL
MQVDTSQTRVQILPPLVAERIAAGEVIERPASVVKELVENALDAGATEVAVHLEDGGKKLIEITDNGLGMTLEDLSLCAHRHATSKLRSVEDLERILTLGFRGEALPSIAAVGELKITSRVRTLAEAPVSRAHTLIVNPLERAYQPEPSNDSHFNGKPHGTRMEVRNLFAQIPARLKFLKANSSEVSQVREWIERLALARPEIGFRLTSDSRQILQLRPAKPETTREQQEKERIRHLLADGEDYPILCEEARYPDGLAVRAYWVQGLSLPHTRKLSQIVNGRVLRDRLLQQAMLSPFRQALLPGQFPALAVYLDVPPSLIDVNVHPTKTEVRFLESGRIFKTIDSALQTLLSRHGMVGHVPSTHGSSAFSASDSSALAASPMPRFQPSFLGNAGFSLPPAQASQTLFVSTTTAEESPPVTSRPLTHARYVGSLFQTYLLFEDQGELWLVDQHAAHERIRFESLKRRFLRSQSQSRSTQQLLIPEAAPFPEERKAEVESWVKKLHEFGFDCEVFGDRALLFRGIPAEFGHENLRVRLKSLLERALEKENPTEALHWDEAVFEKLAMEACRSSVRAGDTIHPEQARQLASDLLACEHPWNCPHGRPTLVRMPEARFEEWFQRRVPG